jgi:hypothetical protein
LTSGIEKRRNREIEKEEEQEGIETLFKGLIE